MEDSLKTLVNIIGSKYSTVLKSSSNESDWVMHFPVPLELDTSFNYELGLMFFSVYNTIFNITSGNNIFKYKEKEEDNQWKTFKVTPGAYELKNLDNYLKTIFPDKIKLEPELTTGKCKMTTKLVIDFSDKNSFAKLLGFEPLIYKPGIHTSQNKINISDINTINIECDLVQGGFYNGIKDNIIYNFPAFTVPVGYKIIERMNPPLYLPIMRKEITDIRFRILDQDCNLISFNKEEINISLHLKQV